MATAALQSTPQPPTSPGPKTGAGGGGGGGSTGNGGLWSAPPGAHHIVRPSANMHGSIGSISLSELTAAARPVYFEGRLQPSDFARIRTLGTGE